MAQRPSSEECEEHGIPLTERDHFSWAPDPVRGVEVLTCHRCQRHWPCAHAPAEPAVPVERVEA